MARSCVVEGLHQRGRPSGQGRHRCGFLHRRAATDPRYDQRQLHVANLARDHLDRYQRLGWRHGALIAMLALLTSLLASLDRRLGKLRGAYAAYGLGCGLLGVAMLLDGFVVPRLGDQLAADAPAGLPILYAIGVTIQIFSKAGLVAHSVAMLAWSWAARKETRWPPRGPR